MPTPIVGAHMLVTEPGMINGSWDNIPPTWSDIRFDTADILYVSPFSALPGTIFGLEGGDVKNRTGLFTKRFEWVVKQARTQNPQIRTIAMQFWGAGPAGGDFSILTTDDLREQYTNSVRDFLKDWQNKTHKTNSGKELSLRVDGYDVDYEWAKNEISGDGNLQVWAPSILSQIRSKVDALSKSPCFYVSITAASVICLEGNTELAGVLDYVNMQNYDGGSRKTPDTYLEAIPNLKPS